MRDERDLNVRELARMADVSASSLIRIEADQVSPNVGTVFQLATALGTDVSALLEGAPPEPVDLRRQSRRLTDAFEKLDRGQRYHLLRIAEDLARCAGGPDRPEDDEVTDVRDAREAVDAAHYIQGWNRETAYEHLDRGYGAGHTAGAQFSKPFEPIKRGDVIWIVFVDDGALHLLARMITASREDYASRFRTRTDLDRVIFSQREAEHALQTTNLWPAPEHLLAQPGTEQQGRDIRVPDRTVDSLRFQTSAGESRVARTSSGGVSGQAFRSVRLLTRASAERLEALWAAGPKSHRRRTRP